MTPSLQPLRPNILFRVLILSLTFTCAVLGESSATDSKSLAQLARQQVSEYQFKQAIETYNRGLAASPSDAVCIARRGFAYANIGNLKQAFSDFENSINRDSNCVDAYSRRARVFSWLGLNQLAKSDANKALSLTTSTPRDVASLLEHANLLYSVGKRSEAEKEYKQILASPSKNEDISAFVIRGNAYANSGQLAKALDCLNQAIKLNPDCSRLYLERGWYYAYSGSKELPLAISDFNRYMFSNPNDPIVFRIRGYCYQQQGNYDKAVTDYDKAIALAPNFAYALYCRGQAHHYLYDYTKAADDFSRAIRLESSDASFYKERAHIYGKHQGEWDKSLKDTQKAIALRPDFSEAYIVQAYARDKLGQFSNAIVDYNKAASLSPTDPEVYYERGMCYRAHKQYGKAIADLSEAIKFDPKNAIKYCARGSALVSDHQYKRAIVDCTKSLEFNSKRTHPHYSRGIAYGKLGQYELALKDFDEAIKQVPNYGEAYFERSLIYKAIGKKDLESSDLRNATRFRDRNSNDMN